MSHDALTRCLITGMTTVIFILGGATASEAQCNFDISAYADGAVGGYYANGNAELWAWGSVIDNSSCQGAEHQYAGQLTVRRASDQQVVAEVPTLSVSVEVTADTYDVSMIVGVWCALFQNWVAGASADTQIVVPPLPPIQCAVPTNFRFDGAEPPGSFAILTLHYAWNSSSGNLSDLGGCEVGERTDYDPTEIPWPPPFPNNSPPNPTAPTVPGPDGGFTDVHSTGVPSQFRGPYFERTITASQVYRYRCPCQASYPNWTTVMGPHNIVRRVYFSGPEGRWRFEINKTGQLASMLLN